MRSITDVRIEEVPNRNMIPPNAVGLFYVANEDQVVVRF